MIKVRDLIDLLRDYPEDMRVVVNQILRTASKHWVA